MKNIHVIQTDKPSRLTIIENKLLLSHVVNWESKPVDWEQGDGVNQTIYITSSEEIKEGDWFYLDMSHSNTLPDEIHQMGNDKWSKTGGIHFCEGNSWVDSCKKIILTTDPDLIKDGVQAIKDDFIEWFVKNPSCEEVEVKPLRKSSGWYDEKEIWHWDFLAYKIIIPKEEPKQETLEEVAEKLTLEYELGNTGKIDTEDAKEMLIEFAKYQAERSYSEEEVYELLNNFNNHTLQLQRLKLGNSFDVKEWFEQFKKK